MMHPLGLPILRSTHKLVCFVLASYVLVLAAAALSPALRSPGLAWVCTGSGVIKLVAEGGGDSSGVATQLDCPMCTGPGVPPPSCNQVGVEPLPVAEQREMQMDSRRSNRVGAALPARGPPVKD